MKFISFIGKRFFRAHKCQKSFFFVHKKLRIEQIYPKYSFPGQKHTPGVLDRI